MIELVCTLLSNNFIFTKELSGISKMEQKKKSETKQKLHLLQH